MPTTETPQIELGTMVRAVNRSGAPVKFGWDSREYVIPEGGEKFIPIEAAMIAFGDPRSAGKIQANRDNRGTVGFIPDRETEVRRLRLRYGNVEGDDRSIDGAPDVELYDIDGVRITHVVDDPEGNSTAPVIETVTSRDALLSVIERQGRQIQQLLELAGVGSASTTPDDTDPNEDGDEDDDGDGDEDPSPTGNPPIDSGTGTV